MIARRLRHGFERRAVSAVFVGADAPWFLVLRRLGPPALLVTATGPQDGHAAFVLRAACDRRGFRIALHDVVTNRSPVLLARSPPRSRATLFRRSPPSSPRRNPTSHQAMTNQDRENQPEPVMSHRQSDWDSLLLAAITELGRDIPGLLWYRPGTSGAELSARPIENQALAAPGRGRQPTAIAAGWPRRLPVLATPGAQPAIPCGASSSRRRAARRPAASRQCRRDAGSRRRRRTGLHLEQAAPPRRATGLAAQPPFEQEVGTVRVDDIAVPVLHAAVIILPRFDDGVVAVDRLQDVSEFGELVRAGGWVDVEVVAVLERRGTAVEDVDALRLDGRVGDPRTP